MCSFYCYDIYIENLKNLNFDFSNYKAPDKSVFTCFHSHGFSHTY